MSLRKPPELTPELLAAKRSNARRSTGPRTPAGKQNSKMNALKHGLYAAPENERQTMLALGEDPEEFEYLKKELMLSYGPGEILWQKQIDDLARLYWRRQRQERAQEGVMRRARLAVEERQHGRRLEMAEATFDAAQSQDLDTERPAPSDPGVRLRWRLSWLKVIGEQVKQRVFEPGQASRIESDDPKQQGWRQARLAKLLRLASESAQGGAPGEEREESRSIQNEARQNPNEAQYQELLRLLEEEIAWVQEEFEYAEKLNEDKVAIERDACLAPAGEEWKMMLRREETLDRSIDRKVRILLQIRKEFQALKHTATPWDQGDALDLEDLDMSMEDIDTSLGMEIPAGGGPVERCSGEFVRQPREGPSGDATGAVCIGDPGGAYMPTKACATPAILTSRPSTLDSSTCRNSMNEA